MPPCPASGRKAATARTASAKCSSPKATSTRVIGRTTRWRASAPTRSPQTGRDGQRGGVGTWRYPDGLAIGHSEGPDENDLWGTVAPAKWRAAAEAAAAAAAAVAASREGEGGAKEEENPINCLAAMGVGKDDAERAALLAKHGGNVEVAVAAFFG